MYKARIFLNESSNNINININVNINTNININIIPSFCQCVFSQKVLRSKILRIFMRLVRKTKPLQVFQRGNFTGNWPQREGRGSTVETEG